MSKRLLLIIALLCSLPVWASWTHRGGAQGGNSVSGTSLTTSSITSMAAGDVVIVLVKWEGTDTTIAVQDSCSNALTEWSKPHSADVSGGRVTVFYTLNNLCTGTVTWTVTWTAAETFRDVVVMAKTPTAAASLDGTPNIAVGTTTTGNSGNITTTGLDGVAFGVYGETGGAPSAESINGIAADNVQTGGVANQSAVWSKTYSAGFTGAATLTVTAAGAWNVGIISFTIAASSSTIQNHFRFRNDDGSETTATWAAAEDANITAALSTTLRLRVQVNTTGDTPTSQKQLEWKKSTDAAYRKVDVAPSQVVYTICASGCTNTTNFVAPSDVFTAVVECYGGGGAGARAAANSTPGGGGKGGSYAKVNAMPLTPGTTYTPTLGAGGVSATPTNGGATDFIGDSTTHCTAAGGVTPAISSLTGATTVNGTSVGDVINLGGNGANGVSTTAGGGGEAGGSAGVGNPGSGSTGGSGAGDGGDGGAGRTVSNGVGIAGTAPGGAGGGALRVSTTSNNGGGGAAGMVRITYTATPAIQLITSANIAAGGGTATTAQLTSPGGAFTAGHISSDTNPLATTDIGANGYEEDEWAIKSFSPAVNGSIYVFRLTLAGSALTTYSVTPQWTIGTGGAAKNCTLTLMGAGPC